MNPKVDDYVATAKQWQLETAELRRIILDCGLAEDFKWSKPCYTLDGANVVLIQGFKAYCALLFFKGFAMNDPEGILEKVGKNARIGRQLRFNSVPEVSAKEALVKAYVAEAMELERSGAKVDLEEPELVLPEELRTKFQRDPRLKAAFEALTPGRQRAYSFHFTEPKQSKTREARIEKCMPRIMEGKGLQDR